MRAERYRPGQALAEWAVVLPAVLLLTLGIIQFALVLIGKTVVNHAAFAATRAQRVGENPADAAAKAARKKEASCPPARRPKRSSLTL